MILKALRCGVVLGATGTNWISIFSTNLGRYLRSTDVPVIRDMQRTAVQCTMYNVFYAYNPALIVNLKADRGKCNEDASASDISHVKVLHDTLPPPNLE